MGFLHPQKNQRITACGWMNHKSWSDVYKCCFPDFHRAHAEGPRAELQPEWKWLQRGLKRTFWINNFGVKVKGDAHLSLEIIYLLNKKAELMDQQDHICFIF